MNDEPYDVVIIGAGFAGLSIANLLADKYQKITVLESHGLPGGCGSFFKRDGLTFDVGATTISGLNAGGPVKYFLDKIGLNLELKKVNPALLIHLNNKKVTRYNTKKAWLKSLDQEFPEMNNKSYWEHIYRVSENAWSLLDSSAHYPVRSIKNVKSLFFTKIFKKFKLAQSLLKTLKPTKNFEYNQMLDELLLIAAQNDLRNTPEMIASLALTYMDDCWYYNGGVGQFASELARHFKKNRSHKINYREEVKKVSKDGDLFKIETNEKTFFAKKVISTLPIWNTLNILEIESHILKNSNLKHQPKWGALTLYAKVKTNEEALYHQIHLEENFDYIQSKSIFVSLSHPKDNKKARQGFRTLTTSIHIDLKRFRELLTEYSREDLKEKWTINFVSTLKKFLKLDELEIVGFGDPLVFEKYTKRKDGSVGGIPHSLKNNILNFPNYDIGVDGFYQIGDTTFPGQGIVGTVQGALNLYSRLI